MYNEEVKRFVQVNVPFSLLHKRYLQGFIKNGLNPEIGLDSQTLDNTEMEANQQVHRTLAQSGLHVTLHGPFIDMSPGSPDDEVWAITRRRFGQVMNIARIFEPKAVVFHTGYDQKRYGFVRDKWVERSIKMWRWLAQGFREQGILLCLENVFEQYPRYLLPVFEHLDQEGVKFCFDIGHHSAFGKAPMEDWLDSLGKYVGQLHLHDNNGMADEHGAIGKGSIRFDLLFDWLGQHFPDPPLITLEPHREEDLLPSLEWLGKNWPW